MSESANNGSAPSGEDRKAAVVAPFVPVVDKSLEGLVLFVDILGYKNMMSMNEYDVLQKMVEAVSTRSQRAVDETSEMLRLLKLDKIENALEVRVISDSIVAFFPLIDFDEKSIQRAISAVTYLCVHLYMHLFCIEKFPLRGAVSYGS